MGEPPLDDPRWLAVKLAIDLREQQTGASGLAVWDLEQAMASGRLRSMRRDLRDPASIEQLEAAFWKAHVLDISQPFVVIVYRRTAIDDTPQRWGIFAHQVADRLDWTIRVWKPDFEKCWLTIGTEAEPDEQKDGWQIARAKELFLIGYPDGVPDAATGKEVQKRLATACKDRGWKLPSLDTIARARGRRR